jgi:hypothetical protein
MIDASNVDIGMGPTWVGLLLASGYVTACRQRDNQAVENGENSLATKLGGKVSKSRVKLSSFAERFLIDAMRHQGSAIAFFLCYT